MEVLLLTRANVGAARRESAHRLLAGGAEWLASTDADSVVADDWLVAQLAERTDAVCGTVEVADWGGHPAEVVARYRAGYVDAPGHGHIHGANLGVSRGAYERAGGFPPIAAHEDVGLVRALERTGAHIAWSNAPRVVTSARLVARAPAGFAAHLRAQHRAIRRVA